ncbi:MAG: CHAT domain-containing protein [Chloroflexota bacterium]
MPDFDVTSHASSGAVEPASPGVAFSADGTLAGPAVATFRTLDPYRAGAAITTLVMGVEALDRRNWPAAAQSIEELIDGAEGAGRIIVFDAPGLIGVYRATAWDPARSAITGIVVGLLSRIDRDDVLAAVPVDAGGLALQADLIQALDEASGVAAEPPAAAASSRAIDFGDADAAATPAAAPPYVAPRVPVPVDEPLPATAQPSLRVPPPDPPAPRRASRGGGLGAVVGAIRSWRRRDERTVDLTVGADSVEIGGSSNADREAADAWIASATVRERAGATMAEPPERTPPGPTYRAYGVLDCAETVLAAQRFPLEVGLSEHQAAGVAGPPLEVPAPEAEPYELEVQLFADGFDLDAGESWRHLLKVRSADLFPTVVVHLTARDLPDHMADRSISATFSIGGETLGVAMRSIRVTKDETAVPAGPVTPSRATGTNISAPTGEPKAHVTITIAKGLSAGSLQWGITSDLPGVALPADTPTSSDIGSEPREFAVAIIRDLAVKGGGPGLFQLLQGIGLTVHDEMPKAVRRALTAAGRAVAPEKLQVLLLTEEPFVPWELAALDEPFDAHAPNFLGAQANVGRWILDPDEPTDPPRAVTASSMAVVWGEYKSATLQRLLAAEEEAKLLQQAYEAASIDAMPEPVTSLLGGTPPADILHFAVHGKYDPQSPGEGLYLVSGPPVVPLQIRGGNLRDRAPFVFLNACQVGSAQDLLGNYGGMAQSFLKAGASAVVAPLWSIDDKVAQQIALEFYRQAFASAATDGNGSATESPPVAELLRRARVGLATNAAAPSATYLAYQFYGHPTMRLSWTGALVSAVAAAPADAGVPAAAIAGGAPDA